MSLSSSERRKLKRTVLASATFLGFNAIAGAVVRAEDAQRPIDEHKPYAVYTVQPGDRNILGIVERIDRKTSDAQGLSESILSTRARDNHVSLNEAAIIQPGDTLVVPADADPKLATPVIPEESQGK